MTKAPAPRAPGAFRVEDATLDIAEPERPPGDAAAPAALPVATPRPGRERAVPWGRLFLVAAGLLASLALGLAIADLVAALFAAEGWLGWLALAVAGIAGVAFLGLVGRELIGLARLSRLSRIRAQAAAAIVTEAQARRILAALAGLYAHRPELAAARAELARHEREVVDPGDLLEIAERAYMSALDAEARRIIGDTVKRISVVTAVSPSALIDLGFVFLSHLGLIRRLAVLYGARPGALGLARLARMVVTHLAVTGGVALGDDLIQQVVGHGIAARVSARLGEGVLNGLLAARIGLAALEVTRPLPFAALKRPRVGDFVAAARASAPAEPAAGS